MALGSFSGHAGQRGREADPRTAKLVQPERKQHISQKSGCPWNCEPKERKLHVSHTQTLLPCRAPSRLQRLHHFVTFPAERGGQGTSKTRRRGIHGHGLVANLAVLGSWLDSTISRVFSNQNDSTQKSAQVYTLNATPTFPVSLPWNGRAQLNPWDTLPENTGEGFGKK